MHQSTKIAKPRKDFPLFPHAAGVWAKEVRGRLHYFGSTASDPKGEAALAKWCEVKDDLLAGRTPRGCREGVTVADLANKFLTSKQHLVDSGELLQRTWDTTTRRARESSGSLADADSSMT